MREMPRAFEGTKKTLQGKWFTQDLEQWDVVSQAVEGGLRGAGVGVWTCQALAAP